MKKIVGVFLLYSGVLGLTAQTSDHVNLLGNWTDTTLMFNSSGARFNEVWGFKVNDIEYGVIGSTMGTHIIEIPENNSLVEAAYIPGAYQGNVVHRDYHDYAGYLYAICQQGSGVSTLQIIDISQLPASANVIYDTLDLITIAHNIFIDSSSAIMYVCGPPGHAMSLYDLSDPIAPVFISHFDDVVYIHDVFVRNDTAYIHAANQGFFVYSFADPLNPIVLGSLTEYPDQGYNHSGWLNEAGNIYCFADETAGMRMKVCDVSDLSDIQVLSVFNSGFYSSTIPHNLMIKDNLVYVSHYNDGLQVFDITDPSTPANVAYYDTYLLPNDGAYKGAWGVYIWLPSGKILISDRQSGLYAFELDLSTSLFNPSSESVIGIYPNPAEGFLNLELDLKIINNLNIEIYDIQGLKVYDEISLKSNSSSITLNISSLSPGSYIINLYSGDYQSKIRFVKF